MFYWSLQENWIISDCLIWSRLSEYSSLCFDIYWWGTVLFGVPNYRYLLLSFRYKVELISSSTVSFYLKLKLCLETNSCSREITVFNNKHLPVPPCQRNLPYKNPGTLWFLFSLLPQIDQLLSLSYFTGSNFKFNSSLKLNKIYYLIIKRTQLKCVSDCVSDYLQVYMIVQIRHKNCWFIAFRFTYSIVW